MTLFLTNSRVVRVAVGVAVCCITLRTEADETFSSLINNQRFKDAITYADEKLPAADRTIDMWLDLATAYRKTEASREKRLVCLKAAQKENPSDPRVHAGFGFYHLDAENYTEALPFFQKSFLLQRTAEAAEGIAVAAFHLKDIDKARDAAESALKIDSTLFESHLILSNIFFKKKNYSEAAKHYEVLVRQKPDSLDYWKKLAFCYVQTGDKEKLGRVDPTIVKLDKKDIDSRRRLATYKLANGDTAVALALYKELAVLTPDDKEVFRNLSRISFNTGRKKDAVLYLKNYIVLDSTQAEPYRMLGDLLVEQGDEKEALAAYRTLLKRDPSAKGFYKRYISLLLKNKLEEEAIRAIQGAVKVGEADESMYEALGDMYKKRKNYAAAIEAYRNVLEKNPKNVPVLTSLGECQAATENVTGAIETYEQVVMMKSDAFAEYKILGDLLMGIKKTDAAMDAYKKYCKSQKPDQTIARTVGLHEHSRKNYKDAVSFLEMVRDVSLHNAEYLIALGESHYKLSNFPKTIQAFEKLLQRKPVVAIQKQILKPLGNAYEQEKQQLKAAEAYAQYVGIPGVSDSEAAYRAAFLHEEKQPASAKTLYEKNTKAYPKDFRNFYRLGLLHAREPKNLAGAEEMLERASSMVDTIPEIWQTLGVVYGKREKSDKELVAYQRLLKLQPQNGEANRRVGILLLEKNRIGEAITNLEITLTLNPKDTEVMRLLADGYLKTNRETRAIELLEKAKKEAGTDEKLRVSLYELYKKTGRYQDAEKEIQQLISLKNSDGYRLLYAQDLIERKRYDDATGIIDKVKKNNPLNTEALMMLAKVQQLQSKLDEAIETYKMVLYIKDDHAPALCSRGDIYTMQGKDERAREYYNKALAADSSYAPAELGLAKLAKKQKRQKDYLTHLNKAKALDPNNEAVIAELRAAGK